LIQLPLLQFNLLLKPTPLIIKAKMGERKRIGILTSGGDCAGLNAVIRAVVYRAIGTYGWEVLEFVKQPLG